MIYTGTAAELAELTRKHWGSEWWPGLVFIGDNCRVGVYAVALKGQSGVLPPIAAASIIFSAAMVWLAEKGRDPLLAKANNAAMLEHSWQITTGACVRVGYPRPSPLHAVLAALEVVG